MSPSEYLWFHSISWVYGAFGCYCNFWYQKVHRYKRHFWRITRVMGEWKRQFKAFIAWNVYGAGIYFFITLLFYWCKRKLPLVLRFTFQLVPGQWNLLLYIYFTSFWYILFFFFNFRHFITSIFVMYWKSSHASSKYIFECRDSSVDQLNTGLD